MCNNRFKSIVTVCLLVVFINRGLFVAMPATETCCTNPSASEEINSLLELVISWAGIHNDIDEDGDSPETYNVAQTIQPLIDPKTTITGLTCPTALKRNKFYLKNEIISSLHIYGNIDHPPEV